jgi:hypothetical protein
MCTPLAAIGLVASAASAGLNYMSQQSMANAQERSNAEWAAMQTRQRHAEQARQDEAREKANLSRMGANEKIDPRNLEKDRAAEEARLTQNYEALNPMTGAPQEGVAFTPQGVGNSEAFKTALGNRMTQATQDAKRRIAALASMQSYGGETMGGMLSKAGDYLSSSERDINLQGNIRQGSLGAFGLEQKIDPVRYTTNPSAQLVGSLAGAVANAAGGAYGTAQGNASANNLWTMSK